MKKTTFAIIVFLIAVALAGCRAQKTDIVTDNQSNIQSEQQDSTKTETDITTEQTTEKDSTSNTTEKETEKEEKTRITFEDGGGTYNANTGEATGVKSVETSTRERELERTNEILTKENTELKAKLQWYTDSISKINIDSTSITHNETHEEEETLNGWQRFIQGCGYAFIMVILAALVYLAYRIYRKFTI